MNYLLSTKGDSCITTIYWYKIAGKKFVSNGVKLNILRVLSMISRNRNDGAFVRVTLLSDSDNTGTARAFASSFSEQVLNLLPDYWLVVK